MLLKVKLLEEHAKLPTKANPHDAGYDLTSTSINITETFIEYGTGISVAIPKGYVGLLFPRSSISKKRDFTLANSVGVIDSGYSGEIRLRFRGKDRYTIGERIGQLVIVPTPEFIIQEVEALPNSDRGMGGFGSTGK